VTSTSSDTHTWPHRSHWHNHRVVLTSRLIVKPGLHL